MHLLKQSIAVAAGTGCRIVALWSAFYSGNDVHACHAGDEEDEEEDEHHKPKHGHHKKHRHEEEHDDDDEDEEHERHHDHHKEHHGKEHHGEKKGPGCHKHKPHPPPPEPPVPWGELPQGAPILAVVKDFSLLCSCVRCPSAWCCQGLHPSVMTLASLQSAAAR